MSEFKLLSETESQDNKVTEGELMYEGEFILLDEYDKRKELLDAEEHEASLSDVQVKPEPEMVRETSVTAPQESSYLDPDKPTFYERILNMNPAQLKEAAELIKRGTVKKPADKDQFKSLPSIPEATGDSLFTTMQAQKYDWDKGLISAGVTEGMLEGSFGVVTGAASFMLGMVAAGLATPALMMEEVMKEGNFTEEEALHALALANDAKDMIMEKLTYMPKSETGIDMMRVASWPFEKVHEFVQERLPEDSSEDFKKATHLVTDIMFLALPKAGKMAIDRARSGIKKVREGKEVELTVEETKTLNDLGQDWRDVEVLDRIAEVDKKQTEIRLLEVEETVKVEQKIEAELIEDRWEMEIEPTASELMAEKFAREMERTEDSGAIRELELKELHKEWQEKRATAASELAAELGPEPVVRPKRRTIIRKKKIDKSPTDKKYPKKTVEEYDQMMAEADAVAEHSITISERINKSSLFDDVSVTEARKAIYDEPVMQNRVKNEPGMALNKLINDVNRSIHGDKSIDLPATRQILQSLNDGAEGFRGYFAGEGNFEAFLKNAEDALEFSRIADKGYKVPVTDGVTLSSGFDPSLLSDTAKQGLALVRGVSRKRKLKNLLSDKFKGEKLDKATGTFTKRWLDVQGEAKRFLDHLNTEESYRAHQALSLQQGAETAAALQVGRMRKAVYSGLSRADRDMVDAIMYFKRTVAIDKVRAEEALATGKHRKIRHPQHTPESMKEAGLTGDIVSLDGIAASKILGDMEQALGPKKFADLNARTEIGFNIMQDMLKMMRDENLITEKTYNKLGNIRYIPRKNILDSIDPMNEYKIGKIPLSVRESGVTGLKKGEFAERLETDSELLMADVIGAAYGRTFRNKTNMALMDIAKTTPDNGFVKIPKVRVKDGKKQKAVPPKGWSKVDLFAGGEKHSLFLKNDFAAGWLAKNREISFEMARRLQIISGSAFIKPTATGMNPGFAMVNLIRDALHVYVAAQIKVGDKWVGVYSPHLPKFVAQYGMDMLKITPDAIMRRGRWNDAVADGMGMRFLAKEGHVFRKYANIQTPMESIMEFLSWITETTEIMGRLTAREGAMRLSAKNKGIPFKEFQEINSKIRPTFDRKTGRIVQNKDIGTVDANAGKTALDIRNEGSFAGRDYMDFSNHGTWGEAVDTVQPFFNPGIQGTRGMWRSAKRNPKEFGKKLAWLGATASGIYFANSYYFKDDYAKLSEHIKRSNFVVMTGFHLTDEFGNSRRMFFKIPKDPSQQYYTAAVEAVTGIMMGDDVDIPGVKEFAASLTPMSGMLPSIPTFEAILGGVYNIDLQRSMWDGKSVKVWRGPETTEETRKEEYTEGRGRGDEPKWAVGLGEMFNISPARMKHAVDSYFARGMYTTVTGKFFDEIIGEENKFSKELMLGEALTQFPIMRRFIGVTSLEGEKVREKDREKVSNLAIDNFKVSRGMDLLMYHYLIGTDEVDIKELYQYRSKFSKHQDRLKKDIDFALMLKEYGKEYRGFWMKMRGPWPIEAKADMYYRRFKGVDVEDRAQMDMHRKKFGYDTKLFNVELNRLRVLDAPEKKEQGKFKPLK